MSSSWTKIQQPEVTSLQDIMCEQIAIKKDKKIANDLDEASVDLKEEDTRNDAVLALMLQKQYDDMLKTSENELSGTSKDFISYSDYSRSESCGMDSELEDKFVDVLDKKHWDQIDQLEKCALKSKCGNKTQEDGNMIIKHNDGECFNLKLLYKDFKNFKSSTTEEISMDEFTYFLLYKLISKPLLKEIDSIINISKKSVIFHAKSDPSYTKCVLPKECVVKVFKTTTEIQNPDKFVEDDQHFIDRYGKFDSRKLLEYWAEKEMQNLNRLKKIGVPCPEVVALKHHVLVSSFIGSNQQPAPKLKDANLKPEDWIRAQEQVCEEMRRMYQDANLVVNDLSENNILWHEGKCWIVDVCQAVESRHPDAYKILFRNCSNISAFFKEQEVLEVKQGWELLQHIVGTTHS